jgi:hypothetical protein
MAREKKKVISFENTKIDFHFSMQELLQEETKGKLGVQSRLRQAEDDNQVLKDQVEEEEDQKALFQKQIADLQSKVSISFKNNGNEKKKKNVIPKTNIRFTIYGRYFF